MSLPAGGKASGALWVKMTWRERRGCPEAQGWEGASSGRAPVVPTAHRTPSSICISEKHCKRFRKGISQIVHGTYLA